LSTDRQPLTEDEFHAIERTLAAAAPVEGRSLFYLTRTTIVRLLVEVHRLRAGVELYQRTCDVKADEQQYVHEHETEPRA
jgi:hypothetical protein